MQVIIAIHPSYSNLYKNNLLAGKKRGRCGTCTGCTADDCQVCSMCLDKPKYGGPGKKKHCCVKRKCLSLQALNCETSKLKPQLVKISHYASTKFLGMLLAVINALFMMVLSIFIDNPSMGLQSTYPATKVSLFKVQY